MNAATQDLPLSGGALVLPEDLPFHPLAELPEYEHVFRDCAMSWSRFDPGARQYRKVTISQSEIPGYWHVEHMENGSAGYLRRPILKVGAMHVLKMWGVPSDPDSWMPDTVTLIRAEPKLERRENCVYFLKAGPFIKIGFTAADVYGRIDQLKTGCPYRIELIGTMRGSVSDERALHIRFRHLNANLEWFHESPELLAFIQGVIAS